MNDAKFSWSCPLCGAPNNTDPEKLTNFVPLCSTCERDIPLYMIVRQCVEAMREAKAPIITAADGVVVLSFDELTDDERKGIAYGDAETRQGNDYFRYKGGLYDEGQLCTLWLPGTKFEGWDGFLPSDDIHGILYKIDADGNTQVAEYALS